MIELLTERVRHHKDKFISPTLYQELRGLEVKKSGKVEHSDLTHDDNLFSYLMALYVWYEGKNLRENFGIEKTGIKTEESVDDVIELEGTEQLGDITEQIAFANKVDNDKFEMQMAQMNKAKNMLFSEYMETQRKAERDQLEIMLQNPKIKEAYARQYKMDVEAVNMNHEGAYMGNMTKMPDSMFLDFNKDQEQINQSSIYYTIDHYGNNDDREQRIYEDDSLQ